MKMIFSYSQPKQVMGTQRNRLDEMVLLAPKTNV